MKKVFVFLFIVAFLISSCSGNFLIKNPKTGIDTEDKTGYGLEVNFKVDQRDIEIGRVYYTLSLKNSGKLPVVISSENLNLHTLRERNGEEVFTKESIDALKKKIFKDSSSIILQKDQEADFSGLLEISAPFKGVLSESFKYVFSVKYDYKTVFNNNIEINIQDNQKAEFKVLDPISQAAPIQITNIELKPALNNNEYIIEYTIEDKGKKGIFSSQSNSKIDNMDIIFGSSSIYGSCEAWYKKGSEYVEKVEGDLRIDDEKGKLVLFCKHTISGNQGKYNTKTTGFMEYEYQFVDEGTLDFPQNKNRPS